MTKFKCKNCGRMVYAAPGSTFTTEQVLRWDKCCKQCNTCDMIEREMRSIKKEVEVSTSTNDLASLFN